LSAREDLGAECPSAILPAFLSPVDFVWLIYHRIAAFAIMRDSWMAPSQADRLSILKAGCLTRDLLACIIFAYPMLPY
jgi:hypothetical protein